jgi:hypothetical protein
MPPGGFGNAGIQIRSREPGDWAAVTRGVNSTLRKTIQWSTRRVRQNLKRVEHEANDSAGLSGSRRGGSDAGVGPGGADAVLRAIGVGD